MSSLVKPLASLLGIVLLLIGIAGFFTEGQLLVFEVDTVHNVVHILSGVIGLWAMKNYSYARLYLIIFGLVYGVVTIIGFVNGGDILGLFHGNDADNYLHLVIAAACLIVGFGSRKNA
jgi:hypothetical protein